MKLTLQAEMNPRADKIRRKSITRKKSKGINSKRCYAAMRAEELKEVLHGSFGKSFNHKIEKPKK